METDDVHRIERGREMQKIIDRADSYFVQHGRFPSKIRVGANIGKRLFPAGSDRAVTPDFTVELDKNLGLDELAIDG
jgi:hypothetical protein